MTNKQEPKWFVDDGFAVGAGAGIRALQRILTGPDPTRYAEADAGLHQAAQQNEARTQQEPKWRVEGDARSDDSDWFRKYLLIRLPQDPQAAAQWTVDPTRCAVSGVVVGDRVIAPPGAHLVDFVTPADCGPGVGGAANEPLYEECLAMQGPPEIVVTDEMVAAGQNVWLNGARERFTPEYLTLIYRAMAAVAPKGPDMRSAEKTKDGLKNTGTEPLVIYDADHVAVHVVYPGETWPQGAPENAGLWTSIAITYKQRIAELEAENTRLLSSEACKGLVNKDLEAALVALEAENAKLRADPVELYRADERKIDALEVEVARLDASRDVAIDGLRRVVTIAELRDKLIIELQKRISALHAENITLRTRAGERDASALQALRKRV